MSESDYSEDSDAEYMREQYGPDDAVEEPDSDHEMKEEINANEPEDEPENEPEDEPEEAEETEDDSSTYDCGLSIDDLMRHTKSQLAGHMEQSGCKFRIGRSTKYTICKLYLEHLNKNKGCYVPPYKATGNKGGKTPDYKSKTIGRPRGSKSKVTKTKKTEKTEESGIPAKFEKMLIRMVDSGDFDEEEAIDIVMGKMAKAGLDV